MTELHNPDYYRRRHQQEVTLAARASDPDIAGIHRDMADRYADLAQQAAGATVIAMPLRQPAG